VDEYPGLPEFAIYFVQTFRNSLGDIATPKYGYWNKGLE